MDGLLKAPSASIEARIAFTEDFFRKSNLSLPMALAAGRVEEQASYWRSHWSYWTR
jgi:hypothetical protein